MAIKHSSAAIAANMNAIRQPCSQFVRVLWTRTSKEAEPTLAVQTELLQSLIQKDLGHKSPPES